MLKSLFTFISFIFTIGALAQNPAYFKLGEKEFTNTNVYSLLFDEVNELLYAGTNNGLYVYRQNKFVPLKSAANQIGSSVFSIKQNGDGVIFCSNLNGQIFKVQTDSLSLLYSVPDDESMKNFNYFIMDNGDLLVATIQGVKVLSPAGEIIKTINKKRDGTGIVQGVSSVSQTPDGTVYVIYSNDSVVYTYRNSQLDSVQINFVRPNALSNIFSLQHHVFSISIDGNLNASSPKINQNYIPKNKEQLMHFDENHLIGLGRKKGIHFLELQNESLYESQHFFDEKFISTFCKNSNGVLFFGSFGEGIYVIPNKDVLISEYNYLFSGMTMLHDTLFLSTREGDILKNNKGLQKISNQESNIDKIFTVTDKFSFNDIPQKGLIYSTKNSIPYSLKDVVQISPTTLIEATHNGIKVRVSDQMVNVANLDYIIKQDLLYTVFDGKRCRAVNWSAKDSLIYYSTGFGVFIKEWNTPKTTELLFNGNTFSGKDLEFYHDTLVCGTEKNGILFFKNKKFLFQISEKNGLMSNLIKKVKLLNGKIYILSKSGFQIYDLHQKSFSNPGLKEGVFNKSITNFELNNGKLWFLEKHRFYYIDLYLTNQTEQIAKLYIDSINVNNHRIDLTDNHTFDYTQNQFEFYYDYRDFVSKNEAEVLYTLEGFYPDWKHASTASNKIEFQSLPIGNYTFKIKASYQNQETEPFIYSFTISAPFWQVWWFYVLILILITLVFWLRLRFQKKKSQLLNEVNTSKLTAIQSQMNPHFIFNALNSIQALVLRGDVDKSYTYINQFSSLVRKTLDFSEKDFIEFESEIQLIEVYLSLEKLRFREDFEYTLNLPEDDEFLVPPMLIQPFIENALVHGLLHKEGLKTLHISFKVTDVLECTIVDNGIGRKEAGEISKRQNPEHESFAIRALANRLDILSKRFNNPIGFEYVDLFDENNNPTGTKVIVKIPIINEF